MSPRQIEVCTLAGCFGTWMSDKAIARELGIGVRTVQGYMADGAAHIRAEHPGIRPGSPRVVCQAWIRQAYHQVAIRATNRAA